MGSYASKALGPLRALVDAAKARADLGVTNAAAAHARADQGVSKADTAQATANTAQATANGRLTQSQGDGRYSRMGIGQSPQSVARSAGTTYRNTTGKTIFVCVLTSGSGEKYHQVSVNGSDWRHVGYATANGLFRSVSYAVPNGHYYRISTGSGVTIRYWMELR